MSMNTSGRRNRSRRSERTQQLYEARSLPVDMPDGQPEQEEARWEARGYPANNGEAERLSGAAGDAYLFTDADYPSNQAEDEDASGQANAYARYPSNEPEADGARPPISPPVEPAEEEAYRVVPQNMEPERTAAPVIPDPSLYYRRPTDGGASALPEGEQPAESQFAYAPPLKLGYTSLYAQDQPWQEEPEPEGTDNAPRNVYHTRDASWAMTDQSRPVERQVGYRVEEEDGEAPVVRRHRKRRWRRVLIFLCALALLAGAGYVFREPLEASLRQLLGKPVEATLPVAAVATPAPVKAYEAAVPMKITSKTGDAISRISGSLEMEPYVVTDTSILARNRRADGTCDFYLFSADQGRLLAYYEGLGAGDVYPLPDGGYYLRQAPYLIGADGSALIKTDDVEHMLGEKAVLGPLMNGWAVVRNEGGTLFNYVNLEGKLLSRLWFAKAWPMTGERTVAYVDTGNQTDLEGRYTLYVADGDGNAVKWLESGTSDGVVASACGAAYLSTGELYLLDNLDAPLLTTDEVRFYADCDAMVARNPETGKYGLYVHGAQHYDFLYDRIEPVDSDMQWKSESLAGDGGLAVLSWVTGAAYPQPLSHYFLLVKDGVEEYVALSTLSACPVILD